MKTKMIKRFEEAGLMLSEEKAAQFLRYYELLVEWNEKFNLTAITEFDDVVDKHFIDSCLGSRYLPESACSLADIGTGAGFPGIPLKIFRPELNVFLLDSLRKRVDFLNVVISELGLTGISALHGRAEEISRKPEFREKFDVCVSRAVASLNSLSELCIPFVKVGGLFLSYKGQKGSEEAKEAAKAIEILGCSSTLRSETLFDAERIFVICDKNKSTPPKYPRGGGKPFSKPL